ncbi:hypothetical protein EFA69_16285 [Rufibacter immobilis]|uniref:Uncharacterized protein n=1 Tax=Rufibacter immobilis TaxID=1348778 RepID=A0A3M9MQ79_9BACT|nr:hypothetical protein [Rufibacter immobilis]RNI27676.1 hypothetical protein EFA69_16285 [Rufibacter immobilis]
MALRLLKREVTQGADLKYSGREYYFNDATKAVETVPVASLPFNSSFSRSTEENVFTEDAILKDGIFVTIYRHDGTGGIVKLEKQDWYYFTITNDKLALTVNHAGIGEKGSITAWKSYSGEPGGRFVLYKMPENVQVDYSGDFGVEEFTFLQVAPGKYRIDVASGPSGSIKAEKFATLEEKSPEQGEPMPEPEPTPEEKVLPALIFTKCALEISHQAPGPAETVTLEIYMESEYMTGDYSKVATSYRDAENDGVATFNIADAINTRLEARQFPGYPDLERTATLQIRNMARFFLRIGHKDPETKLMRWYVSNICTALVGGLPEEINQQEYFAWMQQEKKFMTWQPVKKKVYPNQPELYYFLLAKEELESVNLRVEFMKGANPQPVAVRKYPLDLTGKPWAYRLLQFSLPNSDWPNEADKIRLNVCDTADQAISETRILEIQWQTDPVRSFLFRNSLCVYDVLQATGEKTDSLEVEQQTAERFGGKQFVYHLEGRRSHKISTGYKTREYLEYLQEFLLSRKKAEMVDGKPMEIILRTKKIDYRQDYQGPTGWQFEYDRAQATNFHGAK